MNKDNAHLYLPLVQAMADGRVIQFNQDEDGDWVDINNLTQFNIRPEHYRIKPYPAERWSCVWRDGDLHHKTYATKQEVLNMIKIDEETARVIKLVETTDES